MVHMRFSIFIIAALMLVCPHSGYAASSPWVGIWETADQWGSAYRLTIEDGGNAQSTYGDGWNGRWQAESGGVVIEWENQGRDFIFNGVMGRQRLHTPPPRWGMQGFSSYMKKIKESSAASMP